MSNETTIECAVCGEERESAAPEIQAQVAWLGACCTACAEAQIEADRAENAEAEERGAARAERNAALDARADLDGAFAAAALRAVKGARRSGHSEAVYGFVGYASVRVAAHESTSLSSACGHDSADVEVILEITATEAEIRSALASALRAHRATAEYRALVGA